MCPVLESLSCSVDSVSRVPVPCGLGAELVLREQVAALAAATARLNRELAVRMAALERASAPVTDVRGEAIRAGMTRQQSGLLRSLGLFAAEHEELRSAWLGGSVTTEHVDAIRWGAARLSTAALREQLVAAVLVHLPPLDRKQARRLVGFAVDRLQPCDPDQKDQSDEAARYLTFASAPGGGVVVEGYLPAPDAAALTAAIDALAGVLRVAGDGLTPRQRRADALAALVSIAGRHGLPNGGGLPAALTLTVSLDEAARVALRDPADHGTGYQPRPHGGSTIGPRSAPAADAAVRFGLCCAAITPVLDSGTDPGRGGGTDTDPLPGSLLHRIAGTPAQPLAVGRAVRLATTAQRAALRQRDGGCAIPGCDIDAPYTEPHHVTPWNIGGPTDLDNLVSLCFVHHRMTELGRFRFFRRRPGDTPPPGALAHPLYWILPPRA